MTYDFKARLEEQFPDLEFLSIVEAGSRAWGFASPDSDYDVRFMFMYKDRSKYTSVFENVEHFGFMEGLHDYSGWDIKKVMKLASQSNAALYEHLLSPVIYYKDVAHALLKNYTTDHFCLRRAAHHYRGISQSTYKQHIVGSGEPTMKKWFYIIRPMLCVLYIHQNKTLPPVPFSTLLQKTVAAEKIIGDEFIYKINQLIDLKVKAIEQTDAPQELHEFFTAWIKEMLDTHTFKWIDENIDETPYSEDRINTLYRKIIADPQ